ncbi:MAG: hypothetical protein QOH89_1387 [Pseudonocardiales bacterium]|jgi:DNA-binding transcriptional MerR regulator|nr:hypothetical protein [Pseudonocardiales bacterium]
MITVWMAELSERSGLPVATIKYYLREGLLPPGAAVGATRARYGEQHLRRLRLIRALVDVAQLRLDVVRAVLGAVETADSRHTAIGAAHRELTAADGPEPTDGSLATVDALLARRSWAMAPGNRLRAALAQSLDAIAGLGFPVGVDLLDAYAQAMTDVAEVELDQLDNVDRDSAVEHAIIGVLLLEPVLLNIRRIAEQNASMARFSARSARGAR